MEGERGETSYHRRNGGARNNVDAVSFCCGPQTPRVVILHASACFFLFLHLSGRHSFGETGLSILFSSILCH